MPAAAGNNPSQEWQTLAAAAVLGTDRMGSNLPDVGGPPGRLVQSVPLQNPAEKLLCAASVLAVYELAGREPQPGSRQPEAFSGEDLPECSIRAGQHLSRILGGRHGALLEEWCTLAAATGVRAPDEQIPLLLDTLASRGTDVSESVSSVLGRRGIWLAGLNREWRALVLTSDPAAAWRTGKPAARVAALRRLRATDPGAARELVAETWSQEDPEGRATILGYFGEGLSGDDEAFLEAALDDKRKPVRLVAADLLARLPGSQFAARMAARTESSMRFAHRKGLVRAKPVKIEAVFPGKVDAAMSRDGIEAKGQHGMGQKASVLCQILAGTELAHVEELATQDPAQLVKAACDSDWKEPILRGWCRAAIRQRNGRWAEALLCCSADSPDTFQGEDLNGLASCLEASQAEVLAISWLKQKPDLSKHPVLAVLCGSHSGWSLALSKAVLDALRRHFSNDTVVYDPELRKLVTKHFARFMDPALAEDAATGWKRDSVAWYAGTEFMVDRLSAALLLRRDMREEFSSDK